MNMMYIFGVRSVGVKRLTFYQYIKQLEAPHEQEYKIATLSENFMSEKDKDDYKLLEHMDSPLKGNKMGTIFMPFRNLWWSATDEAIAL